MMNKEKVELFFFFCFQLDTDLVVSCCDKEHSPALSFGLNHTEGHIRCAESFTTKFGVETVYVILAMIKITSMLSAFIAEIAKFFSLTSKEIRKASHFFVRRK
jgi:hypothetical protein